MGVTSWSHLPMMNAVQQLHKLTAWQPDAQGFGVEQIDRLVTLGSPHQAPPKVSCLATFLHATQKMSSMQSIIHHQFQARKCCSHMINADAGLESGRSDQGHPDLGD